MTLLLLTLFACTRAPSDSEPEESPPADDSDAPDDSPDTSRMDQDGDGWSPLRGDCDDTNPAVRPHAEELPDGLDQDCDGIVDEETEIYDDDRDGVTEAEGDCNDADAEISPLATDYFPCDGIDQDCNGLDEPCDSLDEAFLKVVGQGTIAQAVAGGADLSGDGGSDLLTFSGNLYVWPIPDEGGILAFDETDAVMLSDETLFWDSMEILGDTDQDGLAEVAMGVVGYEVYILSAPMRGYSSAEGRAIATLSSGDDEALFGEVVDAGRDASGDGVADLLIGAPGDNNSAGSVYLFSGDARGLVGTDSALARIYGEQEGDRIGRGARFTGDNDGDGVEDIVVGGTNFDSGVDQVAWFAGPVSGTLSIADGDAWVSVSDSSLSGHYIPDAGDVDGDGRDDILLHDVLYTAGRIYLFTQGLSENPGDASARLDADTSGDLFGYAVCVTDVNGDGMGDVVAGTAQSGLGGDYSYNDSAHYLSGSAALFLAPFSGTRSFWEAERVWAGEHPPDTLGYDVADLGDVNGDGFGDFSLAAPNYGDPEVFEEAFSGAAYLFLGKADW